MKFLVLGEREIKNYITNLTHIIISIRSPGATKAEIPFNDNCLDILYLEFHDFDDRNRDYPDYIKLFTVPDAELLLKFVDMFSDKIDLIICQCEAGISRSAGVAGALSKIFNKDDTEFFKNYLPNILVYRTIYETYEKIN